VQIKIQFVDYLYCTVRDTQETGLGKLLFCLSVNQEVLGDPALENLCMHFGLIFDLANVLQFVLGSFSCADSLHCRELFSCFAVLQCL